MSRVAAEALMERLLWPIPRVRGEVCRQIAGLIRQGDQEMKIVFLGWLSRRTLESEVLLPLSIIDGFDLSSYFDVTEIIETIDAPSVLSDALLRRNFTMSPDFQSEYNFAPDDDIPEGETEIGYFHANKYSLIPRAFESRLEKLEEQSGLPFVARWGAEWLWLQTNFPRPFSTTPTYFTDGRRDVTGQFDVGQRELYVSGFLRCLAYSMWAWNVPREVAEDIANTASLLNRGLADVHPIRRPAWSYNTHNLAVAPKTIDSVAKMIEEAVSDCPNSQTLTNLRLAEDEDTYCYEIEIQAVGSPLGSPVAPHDIPEAKGQMIMNRTGFFEGPLMPKSSKSDASLSPLAGIIWPTVFGRLHTDLLTKIVLPYQETFAHPVSVVCKERSIELDVNSASVAKWEHWYARWRPVCQVDIGSTLCTRTLVDKEMLSAFLQKNGLALGYHVTANIGRRDYNYATFQFESESLYVPA